MDVPVTDGPGQSVRPVIDPLAQRLERLVEPHGLARLVAVELTGGPSEAGGLSAVDLAAARPPLVDDHGMQPGLDEAFGRSRPGRAGPDHDNLEQAHAAAGHGPAPVTIRSPAATGVVQARRRSPVSVQTQQSWQAPMRQNPARGPSPNSLVRRRAPAVSTATSSVSPSSASTSAPSTVTRRRARSASRTRRN